ncbi:cingulin-like [Garra rufa]|uniref:cingulin-like n=1 Tax=Garra rufa TaxID=137080 RepID=UPI003CCEE51E
MSAPIPGRKTPVDHGVQIRFINDLQDIGGGVSGQPRKVVPKKPLPRYGVAVRVQGIGGQPYVVLKEGKKGDSYGVQLRTQPPAYGSLPRRKDDGVIQGPYFSSGDTPLRRAQSHGSLLDRENGSEDFSDHLRRPLGDGRSGSYGNLDGGIGMGAERNQTREKIERNQWGGSYQTGLNGTLGRGRGGGSQYTSSESVEISPYNQHTHNHSAPNSIHQTPTHRLADRYDGSSAAQAGNTGTNTRGRYPIPSADNRPTSTTSLPAASFIPNTYSSPQSSSPASAYSSLGRGSGSVAKVTAVSSSASVDGHVTPDLLMDQGQSSGSEFSTEDQIQQIIYDVLRQGSAEGDAAIKHRVRIICNKIQGLKTKAYYSCPGTYNYQALLTPQCSGCVLTEVDCLLLLVWQFPRQEMYSYPLGLAVSQVKFVSVKTVQIFGKSRSISFLMTQDDTQAMEVLGIHGYAFAITNNGYILTHPDLQPLYEEGKKRRKPSYSSVDLSEVEWEDKEDEGYTQTVEACTAVPSLQEEASTLLLSSSEEVDVESIAESFQPLPRSPQYEELLEVVTRAVAKLNISWPSEQHHEPQKSKLDERFLRTKSSPSRRSLQFLPDLHRDRLTVALGETSVADLLLDAPLQPSGLFGDSGDSVVNRYQEARKQAAAFQRYLPRRVYSSGAAGLEKPQPCTSSSHREAQKRSVASRTSPERPRGRGLQRQGPT